MWHTADPICAMVNWHCKSFCRIFLEVKNSVHLFCCWENGCLYEKVLLHFKIKTRARHWCYHWKPQAVYLQPADICCTAQAWKWNHVCSTTGETVADHQSLDVQAWLGPQHHCNFMHNKFALPMSKVASLQCKLASSPSTDVQGHCFSFWFYSAVSHC